MRKFRVTMLDSATTFSGAVTGCGGGSSQRPIPIAPPVPPETSGWRMEELRRIRATTEIEGRVCERRPGPLATGSIDLSLVKVYTLLIQLKQADSSSHSPRLFKTRRKGVLVI
jgi:hypothetical protein